MMSPADEALIRRQIEQAHELAERGASEVAALAFAQARSMCTALADQDGLASIVARNDERLVRERERYRSIVASMRSAPAELLILADSLGLPRPDDTAGGANGADRTYPALVLDHLVGHQVQSYCQRYFTSQGLAELLVSDLGLGAGADVVIHLGLNDCANRMFLERERLALDLLAEDVKSQVVLFAQKYRRVILEHLPSYHYVDLDLFESNLNTVVTLLRYRGARNVVLTNIILPPERFWQGTPGIQQNFGRYNQAIRDVAKRHSIKLFDLDRMVWARQHEDVLLPDGMHLSHSGHRLFAVELSKLLV